MFANLFKKPSPQGQRGFTLIEMSLVLVLMSMAISTFILLQAQQATDNQARAVAQTYDRMNKAVSGYMQTYYSELINVDPACSTVSWASSSGSGMFTPSFSACQLSLQINGSTPVTVRNALQPTPLELAKLGFLDGGDNFRDSLPLPSLSSVNRNLALTPGDWVVGAGAISGEPGGILPERFMVLIQFMCLNGGTVFQFTNRTLCTSGTVDMRSLVFNSQPYNVEAADPSSKVLYQALAMMGADGYLSDLAPAKDLNNRDITGELRTVRGAAEPWLRNPTRMVTGDAGAPFILAMRSGYGTSEWARFKRELAKLQQSIDSVSGTVGNLANAVNGVVDANRALNIKVDRENRELSLRIDDLFRNGSGVQWRTWRTMASQGDFYTGLSCSDWSRPVPSTVNNASTAGFYTIVECRNTSAGWQWMTRHVNWGDQRSITDWVAFRARIQ